MTALTAMTAVLAGCGGPEGEDDTDSPAEEGTGNGQERAGTTITVRKRSRTATTLETRVALSWCETMPVLASSHLRFTGREYHALSPKYSFGCQVYERLAHSLAHRRVLEAWSLVIR